MQDADLDSVNDGLSEALASIPSEPASEPTSDARAATESEASQSRDERGRFKSEAEKAEAAPKTADPDEGEGGRVPAWRLREIREERDAERRERETERRELEALKRERAAWLQQQQRQQPPQRPDLYNDPDAYADYVEQTVGGRVKTVEEMVRDRFVNMTFDSQAEALGKDVFDPMVNAFIQTAGVGGSVDPQLFRSVVEASNPGAALVRWHKRHQAQTEVGGDIDGYNARLRDKLKKDPEFRKEFMAELEAEARGGSPARSSDNITSLPSLNRAPGGAGRQQLGDLGSSDQEMFSNLTRKRR